MTSMNKPSVRTTQPHEKNVNMGRMTAFIKPKIIATIAIVIKPLSPSTRIPGINQAVKKIDTATINHLIINFIGNLLKTVYLIIIDFSVSVNNIYRERSEKTRPFSIQPIYFYNANSIFVMPSSVSEKVKPNLFPNACIDSLSEVIIASRHLIFSSLAIGINFSINSLPIPIP